MIIEIYKPTVLREDCKHGNVCHGQPLGYVAKGIHDGAPYSFAGFTATEAIEKALKYISAVELSKVADRLCFMAKKISHTPLVGVNAI